LGHGFGGGAGAGAVTGRKAIPRRKSSACLIVGSFDFWWMRERFQPVAFSIWLIFDPAARPSTSANSGLENLNPAAFKRAVNSLGVTASE
jgi:hypothetical protein